MWFKVLALLIGSICIGKAVLALTAPKLFYGFRQQQYDSQRLPFSIVVMPLLVAALAVIAWYATVVDYVAWSWLVTGFLTLFGLIGIVNLFRWSAHRQKLSQAISSAETETRFQIDGGILGVGICFLLLGIFVY